MWFTGKSIFADLKVGGGGGGEGLGKKEGNALYIHSNH